MKETHVYYEHTIVSVTNWRVRMHLSLRLEKYFNTIYVTKQLMIV
jgi:hypothetical protein